MLRFALMAATLAAALVLAAPASASKRDPHWAADEIQAVTSAGLLGGSARAFRPNKALAWGELAEVVATLRGRSIAVRDPGKAVTVSQLNAWLVRASRLASSTRHVRKALAAAGVQAPRRVGNETIARMLRLRINHDHPDDQRELGPRDDVTRAEAAYSVARLLELDRWERRRIKQLVREFSLPELDPLQTEVLSRAMRFVGMPYVWGGNSEHEQHLFGQVVPGGFDCSGFTLRVYRSEPFANAPGLGDVLIGRSTYELSAEIGRARRIALESVRAGDMIFFGDRGPKSKPDEVNHMGISLGNGWMVHSSRYGTTITPISDYYLKRFAWARRPAAESGVA